MRGELWALLAPEGGTDQAGVCICGGGRVGARGEKLQNAVILYDQIVNWYTDYLTTDEARENIMEFDRLLPEYAWVSDTKKIDCLLWSKR